MIPALQLTVYMVPKRKSNVSHLLDLLYFSRPYKIYIYIGAFLFYKYVLEIKTKLELHCLIKYDYFGNDDSRVFLGGRGYDMQFEAPAYIVWPDKVLLGTHLQ